MDLQSGDTVPCPWVPEFHHVILASGNQQAFRRVPLHALDIPPMTCKKISPPGKCANRLPLPVNTRSSRCSSKAHIRTVESSLAVANLLSSGLKLNARMASRWPFQAVRLFMLGWKYLITPLWSAEAKNAPEWVNRIARIAVSCAWRIVSKLNVNPFHSVNSPLVDPVRTRRYSGVHYSSRNASEQFVWLHGFGGAHHDTIHWTSNLVCGRVNEFGA